MPHKISKKMKKLHLLFLLLLVYNFLIAQNNISFRKNNINKEDALFMSFSVGYANANLTRYRTWARQVSLQSVEASEDYLTFGAEFGGFVKGNQIQFEVLASAKTLSSIAPNLFQFSFRYGRILHSYKNIDFVASGGLGFCNYTIHFKGNPPPYLSSLPYNPTNAYATQSSLLFTPEFAVLFRPKEGKLSFGIRVGYNVDVFRSVWKYGENIRVRTARGGSTSRFIGQEVSGIPNGALSQFLYTKLSVGYWF